MKYNITVDGVHKATVEIDLDARGGFAGSVVSPDFGTGAITNGVKAGDVLKGNVALDGYNANFSATLNANDAISGTISYWFVSKGFVGTLAA